MTSAGHQQDTCIDCGAQRKQYSLKDYNLPEMIGFTLDSNFEGFMNIMKKGGGYIKETLYYITIKNFQMCRKIYFDKYQFTILHKNLLERGDDLAWHPRYTIQCSLLPCLAMLSL